MLTVRAQGDVYTVGVLDKKHPYMHPAISEVIGTAFMNVKAKTGIDEERWDISSHPEMAPKGEREVADIERDLPFESPRTEVKSPPTHLLPIPEPNGSQRSTKTGSEVAVAAG